MPRLRLRLIALVSLAMFAFAGNSMLYWLALKHTSIDAASFTKVRLLSGALMLWLVVRFRSGRAATLQGICCQPGQCAHVG